MKKPAPQKSVQDDYIKTGLRMPPDLHIEVKDSAKRKGHTMNAEIIARLQAASIVAKIDRLEKEQQEMKAMIKEILAAISGR